ncbi:MAG: LemA family protein [Bacteroidetes bacterium CG23_combo_of_CG06-09_8_20_14_all_32_9]|nr:MAG: LemA family protein [Bacteroidetes bacterium CG23_combo_of_CG06-09_8_20_14_all_32_9]
MEELQNKYDKNLKTKGTGCLGATLLIIIIGIFLIIISIFTYSYYNGLVTREEKVNAQWAQVENLYQRRADLINNLVSTVKGYATHEKTTLTAVTEARSKASSMTISPENLNDETIQKFEQVQGELTSSLQRLMVVVEQYPNLKANQGFLQLQSQLEQIENGIADQRNLFNEIARDYNIAIRKFPRNLFAVMFGFKSKSYFKATPGADKVPVVKF